MDLSRVSAPLEGWFGFIRQDFFGLFRKLFVVNLYAMGAVLLGIIAISCTAAVALAVNLGLAGWALIAVAIFLAVILMITARLIRLASYKVIDEEHGAKRRVDILGTAREKAVPAIIYFILRFAIYAVVLIPLGLLGTGIAIATGSAGIISPLLQLGIWLVSIVVGFFLQFALFELVLAGKGPLECMKSSYGLVKRNFWETVVFYIASAVVAWIVWLPFAIVLVAAIIAAVVILGLGGMALAILGSGPIFVMALIALLALLGIPFIIAYNAADETACMSLAYRYWRFIRGDVKMQKPQAKAGAPSQKQGAGTQLMVASQPGPMATVPEQTAVAVRPEPGAPQVAGVPGQKAKAAPKKAPAKRPATKRAANKKPS
jgi:hypothetical protein